MALSYSNVKLSKWPGLKSQWITVPSWYFDVFSINFALQKFNNTLITVDVSYSILWSLNIHSKRQARKSPRLVTSNDIEPNVLPNRDESVGSTESVEDIYDEIGPPNGFYSQTAITKILLFPWEDCIRKLLKLCVRSSWIWYSTRFEIWDFCIPFTHFGICYLFNWMYDTF